MIIGYEVKWSFREPCIFQNTTLMSYRANASEFQYIGTIDNPNTKNLYACVRALTSNISGPWGTNDLIQAGLLSQDIADCDALVTVASVAGLSVMASVLMVIILSLSIYQYKCTIGRETK